MLERTRFDQGTTLHPDPNGNNLVMQQTNQMINNNTTSTATTLARYPECSLVYKIKKQKNFHVNNNNFGKLCS